MAFANPAQPNLADFSIFLSGPVGIPAAALPSNSPWPGYALDQAIALAFNPVGNLAPILYTLAVYNCATHLLFEICPDQTGQTYFKTARGPGPQGYALNAVITGLVVASSDETTSATLTAPVWADGLTIGQLGMTKTPWGRQYLSWTQSFGPSVVGLT